MSREIYEKVLKQAAEKGYWALHTALTEDGYQESVDYSGLLDDEVEGDI